MANEIQELLKEIKDERLRARLSAAIAELRKNKKFGLVFEEHIPELLPIYSAKVRGSVRVARRGARLTETFIVQNVAKGIATVAPEGGDGKAIEIPVSELVVVKRFGEAIFPSLRHVESVVKGGDSPHHTLIEADNYHALQLLEWLYAGRVDCIYIDPPYNTGSRDWKYNNDYVDETDGWRHSKWLAFMQRRLEIARRLLNPENSVLIVTIDEKEYSRLGLLLEQVFVGFNVQMVSTLINPAAVARAGAFGRSDEYIYFVTLGRAAPQRLRLNREWVSGKGRTHTGNIRWDLLRRSGEGASRKDSPGCFYAIYINPNGPKIEEVGDAIPAGRSKPQQVAGCVPVLPIRKDGSEGRWQWTPTTLRERLPQGRVRVTGTKEKGYVISILKDGEYAKIQRGEFQVAGRNADGSVIVEDIDTEFVRAVPASQWRISSHDATQYGSRLLADVIPGRPFPFPKSVYAVRDAIRFFVEDNPNALILDFFAGSGTTLNSVALLNEADGGKRRCILVTNNEVSDVEAQQLRAQGLEPGHADWERHGICQSVTYPRCKAVIEGRRDNGDSLPGEYLTGLPKAQETARAIRPLDFVSESSIATRKARQALALALGFPKSKVVGGEPFLLSEGEKVAVLFDPDAFEDFLDIGESWSDQIETVYLPFRSGRALDDAKSRLNLSWPPLIETVEAKRPMRNGFAANLDYFRLDFLDRSMVEIGGKLPDILPALWMMAGSRGSLPTCKGNEKMLFYKGCPFAVLVDESSIKQFLSNLEERSDIDWAFLITNDQDSFARMCEWLPDQIPAAHRVHLWRNYVDNFLINVDRGATRESQ